MKVNRCIQDSLDAKLIQQLTYMREEVLHAIFLCLHKVYDTMDRYIYLDILDGYGVVPRACLILCNYWDRIRIVALARGIVKRRSKFLGG